MSDFDRCISFVLRMEGGLSEHPSDPGGTTNYGISQRSFPHLDIKNLAREEAVEIYRTLYWDRADCDSLPWPMNLLVFDTAVNSGVGTATRWLRQHPTFNSYLANRLRFYTDLNTWGTFGKGWTRRMAALVETAGEQPASTDVVILNYPLHRRILDAIKGRIDRPTAWRIRPKSGPRGLKLDLADVVENQPPTG